MSEPLGGVYKITISHKGSLQRFNEDGVLENTTQRGVLVVSGPGIFSKSEQELDQLTAVSNFLVAPIPAKKTFTVSALNNNIPFKDLTIIGLDGKVVLRKSRNNFSLKSTTVAISVLPTGTYVLGIETETGTNFRQILIAN